MKCSECKCKKADYKCIDCGTYFCEECATLNDFIHDEDHKGKITLLKTNILKIKEK